MRPLALIWLALGAIACAKGATGDANEGDTTDAGVVANPVPPQAPTPPSRDAAVAPTRDAGAIGNGTADGDDAGTDPGTDASADAATDAGDPNTGSGCFGDASNFDPSDGTLDFSVDVTLACSPTIDTSKAAGAMLTGWCGDAPTLVIQPQTGGPSIVVVPMASFTLAAGQTLRLIGDKPVVLAVDGDATIEGTINAGAAGSTPGAGGNVTCAAANNGQVGSTPLNPYTTGSGGGGFGGVGGAGGIGWNPTNGGAGGTISGTPDLNPLRGGCKGANGFKGAGTGGAGGGAVQLSVVGTLTVGATGRIAAPGGGGMGGSVNWAGGAGGGSGGAVLIEAGTLDQDASSLNSANGGAGGGARYVGSASVGQDGHINDVMPAVGGATDNATFGGPGGNGGTQASPNGAQGGTGTAATKYGGGGGGGGYGIVISRTLSVGGSC